MQTQPENGEYARRVFESSPAIGALTKALSEAVQEFPKITKDTENPYFRSRYADLSALIDATRPALAKHGLTIMQLPEGTELGAAITTLLSHVSGEWIASRLSLPATKKDAQGLGSAITYARRYAYQSILNIAGEEDDDGNAATGKTQEDQHSSSTDTKPGLINAVQLRAFNSACKTGGRTERQIADYLRALDLEEVSHLPKEDFQAAIKWALNAGNGSDTKQELDLTMKAVNKKKVAEQETGEEVAVDFTKTR